MQRPDERDFLQAVLRDIEGLPGQLAARLMELVDAPATERAEAMRRLFEELGRG
jgi:hypothetical protein